MDEKHYKKSEAESAHQDKDLQSYFPSNVSPLRMSIGALQRQKTGKSDRKESMQGNLHPISEFARDVPDDRKSEDSFTSAKDNEFDINNFKELSKDEVKRIVTTQEFGNFFDNASKIIEKALNQEFDVARNYFETVEEEENQDGTHGEKLAYQFTFQDEVNPIKRSVTQIQWSPKFHELLMASYSKSEEYSVYDQDGLVMLWSLALRKRPEYSLFCQSEVTSAVVHPFSPNLVIGGTYSGYIVIWDIRAKNTPVERTSITQAQTYPIFSLSVVGTQNAHNIVALSNNGRISLWSSNMLNQPNKIIDLKDKENKDHAVSAQCMAFPEQETNNCYIGAEDSKIYHCQIHSDNDSTGNVIETLSTDHFGPISGLAFHPQNQQSKSSDFTNCLLSSSMDWTVKLWNPKITPVPLASFESSEDYALDVQWSPAHPGIFSACDAEGYVDIWDLIKDSESPILHYKTGDKAINKIQWSTDGKRIAVGDSVGNLHIYLANKSMYTPKPEDTTRFDKFLQGSINSMNIKE